MRRLSPVDFLAFWGIYVHVNAHAVRFQLIKCEIYLHSVLHNFLTCNFLRLVEVHLVS
jgi:hypothetical protein